MVERKMKKTGKRWINILAVFLAVCMCVTGIPFGELQVKAEGDTATVTRIYAEFPQGETGEPSIFEIAESAPEGKELFAKFISDGSYTLKNSATDNDAGIFLMIDNASVVNPNGIEIGDYRLSGNSSLDMGAYTVDSTSDRFPAYENAITIDNLLSFYDSSVYLGYGEGEEWQPPKAYSYTFTGDTTWTGWRDMDTVTINEGVILTIACGSDGTNTWAGGINAKSAVINGTMKIENSTVDNKENLFAIDGGGSLIVGENGSIVGEGNAFLEIREQATVSGITLYDRYDEISGWISFSCDGNQGWEGFSYNTEANRWVRNQNDPGNAGEGGLPDNTYRIIKIGDEELALTVNGTASGFDEGNAGRDFTKDTAINFTITGAVYKVIVVPNDPEVTLTGTNGSYSYTPNTDSGFEILVYTTKEAYDYDHCQPGEEQFSVEYQVRYQDEEAKTGNTVACDSEQLVKSATNGEWTKLILNNSINSVPLTITVARGYEYEVTMHGSEVNTDVTDDVKNNSNKLNWDVSAKENSARPEIYFKKAGDGGEPGPGPEDSPDLESYIKSQQFAFGDWDEDGDVDENDLKLGMAYQIYYPRLNGNENQDLREEYHVPTGSEGINYLKDQIVLASGQDLRAEDATGTIRIIPGYTYTVNLFKGEDSTPIQATGTVYAFAFDDDSKYQQNNCGCVIAVTEKAGVKSYFLRCVNDYTNNGEDSDNTLMVSGGNEAPIVVVSDFDVNYNEQKKTYDRKVSIFGNGASLDHLLSQEEDMDVVAYQGRNEDFMRDIGKEESWGSIFSVFTFCQKSFEGVQVQGSGASGSTPSWAYNQYPIFSTDDVATTEKEAVVYFGNTDVTIKPVDNLTGVNDDITGIDSVELADSGIPTDAVDIARQSDTEWKVKFNSDFYDQVKVKIVYTLEGGGTKTSYLNIHRVGIDILAGEGRNGGMTLFHGTDNGPTYYNNAAGERVIWGTYYYPEPVGDSGLVDLYVTYTWPDGSITKKTIRNSAPLNMEPANGNCQSSDFILYDGTNEGAPTKIEAIAVVNGFDNTASTTFSGAEFGAGKGVVWNNYLGN